MAKYKVWGTVIGSKYLGEFEASSPEEAEEMALDSEEVYVRLCHQCNDQIDDPEIHKVEAELIEE